MAHEWKSSDELPDWDHRPIRHFIRAQGYKEHSGMQWGRVWFDVAYIDKKGHLGYRESDIARVMKDGDMDFVEEITHWRPAMFDFPHIPYTKSDKEV